MLENKDGSRKAYKISSNTGINKKPDQDTPKEDFIFCTACESSIANKYEGPIASQFYYDRENPKSFFYVTVRNHYQYRIYYKIDYQLFMKFFYSIIFRASISNHENFKHFNIPQNILEKLRRILIEEIPFEDFPLLVFTCPHNPHPTGNFIGALTYNNKLHMLGVNEYILLLDLSPKNRFGNRFKGVYYPNYRLVRILTIPFDYWNSWIKDTVFETIMDKLLKKNMLEHIIDGLFLNKLLKQHKIQKIIEIPPLNLK